MLKEKRISAVTAAVTGMFLVLLAAMPAQAQTPDTVYRKPELPTGPPTPVKTEKVPQQVPVVVQPPQQEAVQDETEMPKAFLDRLYYGGSFGLQFGTYTNISLLPILGYKVTDKLSVGPGLVYHYSRINGQSLNNYGGRFFAQHEVLSGLLNSGSLLVHGELEVLSFENYWPTSYNTYELSRRTVTTPLAGVGYRQSAGRASFDLLLLYNFNEIDSPYSNPVIRAGFNIPFRR